MGRNPLSNLVSALLLATTESTLCIVHSQETEKQARALERVLNARNYQKIILLIVQESDKDDIVNKVTAYGRNLSGSVGLSYTGGTKATAVHAYRAVEQLRSDSSDRTYYSYIDPLTLSMRINGTDITGVQKVPIGTAVQVSLEEVLDIHDFQGLQRSMNTTVVWSSVLKALGELYSSKEDAKTWKAWCEATLRRSDNRSKFRASGEINQLTTDSFPFESIREALNDECPDLEFPSTFQALVSASDRKQRGGESLAKWFDGIWFEQYAFQVISSLEQSNELHSIRLTSNPTIKKIDFELDIAFMRGYQLFGIVCTTSSDKKEIKLKLLEAVIRARQLGGSEARIGLVCCTDDASGLEEEVYRVVNDRDVRVFGRRHLCTLGQELSWWINQVEGD